MLTARDGNNEVQGKRTKLKLTHICFSSHFTYCAPAKGIVLATFVQYTRITDQLEMQILIANEIKSSRYEAY